MMTWASVCSTRCTLRADRQFLRQEFFQNTHTTMFYDWARRQGRVLLAMDMIYAGIMRINASSAFNAPLAN